MAVDFHFNAIADLAAVSKIASIFLLLREPMASHPCPRSKVSEEDVRVQPVTDLSHCRTVSQNSCNFG